MQRLLPRPTFLYTYAVWSSSILISPSGRTDYYKNALLESQMNLLSFSRKNWLIHSNCTES